MNYNSEHATGLRFYLLPAGLIVVSDFFHAPYNGAFFFEKYLVITEREVWNYDDKVHF